MQSKLDYLKRRERQELEAAESANDPKARQVHRELAARYAWQRELHARITEGVS
jgi:hypothetical protein